MTCLLGKNALCNQTECAHCGWDKSVRKARHKTINHGAGLKKTNGLLGLRLKRTKRDTEKPISVDKKKLAKMLRAGKSAAEISKALGCTQGTARLYRSQFRREGV